MRDDDAYRKYVEWCQKIGVMPAEPAEWAKAQKEVWGGNIIGWIPPRGSGK